MGEQNKIPDLWLDRDAAAQSIRNMNEDDLRFLNTQIVERLKLIAQARSTVEMSRFSVGQQIEFQDRTGQPVKGQILRLNKKAVSIVTDNGQRWNVSPQFVRALPA